MLNTGGRGLGGAQVCMWMGVNVGMARKKYG